MRIALMVLCFALSACNVYKTSDRDYFNSNAVAGAPRTSSKPMAESCGFIGLEALPSLGLDLSTRDEDAVTLTDTADTVVVMAAQHKGTQAATCAFTYANSIPQAEEAGLARLREVFATR